MLFWIWICFFFFSFFLFIFYYFNDLDFLQLEHWFVYLHWHDLRKSTWILSSMVEMCICISMVERRSKWILFGRRKTNISISMTLYAGNSFCLGVPSKIWRGWCYISSKLFGFVFSLLAKENEERKRIKKIFL